MPANVKEAHLVDKILPHVVQSKQPISLSQLTHCSMLTTINVYTQTQLQKTHPPTHICIHTHTNTQIFCSQLTKSKHIAYISYLLTIRRTHRCYLLSCSVCARSQSWLREGFTWLHTTHSSFMIIGLVNLSSSPPSWELQRYFHLIYDSQGLAVFLLGQGWHMWVIKHAQEVYFCHNFFGAD